MVDVSAKKVTSRLARARATVWLGKDVLRGLQAGELATKKGPVFHTAIVAGVMAAKKTAELIPFCHPLALHDCQVKMDLEGDRVVIAWRMLGTQTGAMGPVPPTGRPIAVQGMTVYFFRDGRITGHRQVVDRLGVVQQLGLGGPRAPASAEQPS